MIDNNLNYLIQKFLDLSKNKNENSGQKNFEKINLLFKQFMYLEKVNLKEVIYFPKLINTTNNLLNEYLQNNKNSNFKEVFLPIKNIITFYSKFYVEFKQYIFTENSELQNIFKNYNQILTQFYPLLNNPICF